MDGVAAPPPYPLDETTPCSSDIGASVRPADVAAARPPAAIGWAARAISAVAAGMAIAAGIVEFQLTTQLTMVTTWLSAAATDGTWRSLAHGPYTHATVSAAFAAGCAAELAALTATTPVVAAVGGMAGLKTGLLLAAWHTAGWRQPATGAAAALRQRLAGVFAVEAAVAVALLLAAGGLPVGIEPNARVVAAAACAFALQAAVAIGVARYVALPAAIIDGRGGAAGCGVGPPVGTAIDPGGPVWTWVAARPAVARTSVLVTAGLAASTAAAALAAAGAAAATRSLRPDAPGAVVVIAVAAPVLVVTAAAVGAWRRWVRSWDWAAWCKGGGAGDVAPESAPLISAS